MKDLLDYNRFRIETMQSKICELESIIKHIRNILF
jgi:hypothetical protein